MVKLRELHINDALVLAKLLNNKHVWNNLQDSLPYPYTEADAEFFINLNTNNNQMINFAITFDKDFCGVIGIKRQEDIHRKSVELGYWIGEPYWHKGVATKAIEIMTTLAFEKENINRIFARVFENNMASMKALLKNNYKQEAILKQAVYKNNRFLDEYIFAIVKPD